MRVPLKPDYNFIIERSNGIEWYFYIPLSVPLKCFNTGWSNGTYWVIFSNTIENTTKVWFIIEQYAIDRIIEPRLYYWIFQWYWMVFWNTIENTTEVTCIVAQYVQILLREQLKQDVIIEWSDLLLKGMFHYRCEYHWCLILSLNSLMVLNGIINYRWKYHWVLLKYHWMVQWYWMVFNGIPLALFCQGHWWHYCYSLFVTCQKLVYDTWEYHWDIDTLL